MIIGIFKEYKGFRGSIEYDLEDNVCYGRILDIPDNINYHSVKCNLLELFHSYQNSVDQYIIHKKYYTQK